MLVFAAVLWAWSDESTLGKRFTAARKLVIKMFPWQKKPGESYQGFIKANEARFHPTKKRKKPSRARKGQAKGLTKKASLKAKQAKKRKHLAKGQASGNSKKQLAGPQIWLTLFWHVGLGLPWAWKTGPVDSSERADMLPEIEMQKPEQAIGHNTLDAMRSGVYFGLRGMVRELVEQYAETLGSFPMVAVTGGDGNLLFRDFELVDRIVPNLTMMGLYLTLRVATEQQSQADN